jgi:hypothetical protein
VLLPHRRRRSNYDYKILLAYLLGTTSGALLTSVVVWMLSGFVEPLGERARATLLIGGAVVVVLSRHGPLAGFISLPESRRQIPAEVFGGSLLRGAYRFGLELGTGVRTYVSSSAPYILLLAVFFARLTLADALLIGVGFGVGRAFPLMVQLAAGSRLANPLQRRLDSSASATAALLTLAGALFLV